MKKNKKNYSFMALTALALFALISCKNGTITEPSPLGPSSIGVVLGLSAKPSVILAGELVRQKSDLTATLAKYDGIPISGRTILFELVSGTGRRMNIGYLDGEASMLAVVTDSSGTARTRYFGPLKSEIRGNADVYVRATVVWDDDQHIQDAIQIYVIRDSN